MERQTKVTNIAIIALAVAVVFMSVGFALYSQQLTLNGTATVQPATWSVKFDTTTGVTPGQGSVAATTSTLTDTSYTYAFTLAKPGDFFEMDIPVVNAGTINAQLKTITMSQLSASQSNYLSYTLSYNGTPYTQTTTLSTPVALNAQATATVKVKVEYLLPNDSANLPQTAQTVTITGALDYESVN